MPDILYFAGSDFKFFATFSDYSQCNRSHPRHAVVVPFGIEDSLGPVGILCSFYWCATLLDDFCQAAFFIKLIF